jgi:dynein light intermediate chain 1
MQDVMQQWTQRKRGGTYEGQSGVAQEGVVIPLGSGEWDEPLGIPVCVVCQNVDQMDALEKERGWKEEDFDYVLQFLRTILLKRKLSSPYPSLLPPLTPHRRCITNIHLPLHAQLPPYPSPILPRHPIPTAQTASTAQRH